MRSRHRQEERRFEVVAGKVIDAGGAQQRTCPGLGSPQRGSSPEQSCFRLRSWPWPELLTQAGEGSCRKATVFGRFAVLGKQSAEQAFLQGARAETRVAMPAISMHYISD